MPGSLTSKRFWWTKLTNCPSQIWNCDESDFDMQGCAGKIIAPSEKKQDPYCVLTGQRAYNHVSLLPCVRPMDASIFHLSGEGHYGSFQPLEGGVEGSVFSVTDSGYMDTQTFYMWFANHFAPSLPPARPVVLLISHDSHLESQSAEKNGIYLYLLLKNATHLVQPADVGRFGPMKKACIKRYENILKAIQTDISKKYFCSVFKVNAGRGDGPFNFC